MDTSELRSSLDVALAGPTIALAPTGHDPVPFLEKLRAEIRAASCEPFWAEATVMAPGFPFAAVGTKIGGFCVARAAGYWLVYDPHRQTYYAFWGDSTESLGARGVFGDPIYCWWA
jgi:hypothetical protein